MLNPLAEPSASKLVPCCFSKECGTIGRNEINNREQAFIDRNVRPNSLSWKKYGDKDFCNDVSCITVIRLCFIE